MNKLGKLTKNTAITICSYIESMPIDLITWPMSNTKCFDNNGKNLVTL